jgi:hypothetical protein
VNSVFRLLAFGFMPIGAALSGILIERLGVVSAVLACWAVVLALLATAAVNRPLRAAAPVGRRAAS